VSGRTVSGTAPSLIRPEHLEVPGGDALHHPCSPFARLAGEQGQDLYVAYEGATPEHPHGRTVLVCSASASRGAKTLEHCGYRVLRLTPQPGQSEAVGGLITALNALTRSFDVSTINAALSGPPGATQALWDALSTPVSGGV